MTQADRSLLRSWIVVAIVVAIGLLDIVTHIAYAVSALYVLPILLTLRMWDVRNTWVMFGAVTMLTWVGAALSPGAFTAEAISNRGIVSSLLLVVAWLVTRQKQSIKKNQAAEVAIQESRDQLHTITEATSDSIFLKDLKGRYLLFNAAAGGFAGKRPEDVLGHDDTFIFPAHDARCVMEEDRAVIAGGRNVTLEGSVVTAGGGQRVFQSTKGLLQEPNGSVVGLFGMARDITEQRHAEQALRTSEAQLRAVTDSIPGAVYQYELTADQIPKVLFISHGVQMLMGVTPAEVGEDLAQLWEFILPEDRPRVMESLARSATSVSLWEQDFRVHLADGTIKWIKGKSIPGVRRADGSSVWNGILLDISLHKQAEEVVLESLRFIRSTLDAVLEHIAILADTGEILAVNQAWRDVALSAGPSCVSLLEGANYLAVCDAVQGVEAPSARAFADGLRAVIAGEREEYTLEYQCLSEHACYWNLGTVVRLKGKGPVRVVVAHEDISKRKQAEHRLQLTQYAVDQASDQIFLIDQHGAFLDVNESACRRLGYSKDELLRMSVIDIDPVSPMWGRDSFWAELVKTKRVQMETRHRSKTGEIYSVEMVANYLTHEGQELGYAIVRDITERKRHEAALLESEERFSKAFNESAIGMAIVAPGGRWLEVNPALCEIVGYSDSELKSLTVQAITHPDDLEGELQLMRQLVSGTLRNYQLEKRYLHKDGSVVWIVLTVSLVRHADGTPKHFISQIQDITVRKWLQEQNARYMESLERQIEERTAQIAKLESQRAQTERLVAVGQLAAGVAHEINNPIAGIKNAFLVIKPAISEDFPYYNFVGLIDREIDRVARIVRSLYQLSTTKSLPEQSLDVKVLFHDLTGLVTPSLSSRQLALHLNVPPSLPEILLPQRELLQVLLNLLQNAITVSPEHGVIELRVEEAGSDVTFSVIDQGPGIASDVLPHIFDPFFTSQNGITARGMGLGLSISHNLVYTMGGRITVHTEVGKGSMFCVVLPIGKDNAIRRSGHPTLREGAVYDDARSASLIS